MENKASTEPKPVCEKLSKVLRELNLFLDTDTFYEYVNEAVGEIVPDEDVGKERIIVMSE